MPMRRPMEASARTNVSWNPAGSAAACKLAELKHVATAKAIARTRDGGAIVTALNACVRHTCALV